MQIYDSKSSGLGSPAAAGAGAAAETQAASVKSKAATGSGLPTDAVELSSFAQQLNDLQSESTGREARVEQLRSLYLSGNYQPDSSAIASRMVDDALVG